MKNLTETVRPNASSGFYLTDLGELIYWDNSHGFRFYWSNIRDNLYVVTNLTRVEGFQEVLLFLRNISSAYILVSLCLLSIAPQTVIAGTSLIHLPHGLVAHSESQIVNAIASFGCASYLYAILVFSLMFLYRYNVLCQTRVLSTIFSLRNINAFLIAAGVFCFIQAVLFYYSTVDSLYLMDRLNRTKDLDSFDLRPQFENLFSPPSQFSSPIVVSSNTTEQVSFHHPTSDATVSLRNIGVFGYDYTRNPMIFLSIGIYTMTTILSSISILIISLIISSKLRGHQENMSDKSQAEQTQLINVLILDAYIPILLTLLPAVNFAVCIIRQDSLWIQEYLGMLLIAPIALLFPTLTVFLIRPLRSTAFQVLFCVYWRNQRAAKTKAKAENAVATGMDEVIIQSIDDKLNPAQLSAIRASNNTINA
ncbi:7TM GPCR, serpentine receptor class r (Str) family-containing protein [Aphelenchoides besseyi]|nr:7TM GPCR, serpentine receptor class r (Str) family-containing protein [Aphelenchoides besseyi]KAI6199870.1 7TM GPCR, serpentine receptor class r (Str) family-containing protein [Aphelenchoides besseyi]